MRPRLLSQCECTVTPTANISMHRSSNFALPPQPAQHPTTLGSLNCKVSVQVLLVFNSKHTALHQQLGNESRAAPCDSSFLSFATFRFTIARFCLSSFQSTVDYFLYSPSTFPSRSSSASFLVGFPSFKFSFHLQTPTHRFHVPPPARMTRKLGIALPFNNTGRQA